MRFLVKTRYVALAAGFALAALVAASWGGGDGPAPAARPSGPVVALYVVDHGGADPTEEQLAPYEKAFERALAGCKVSAADLSSVVFTLSDRATMGSGVEFKNLAVIRALAEHVGTTPVDCERTFQLTKARLIGSVAG